MEKIYVWPDGSCVLIEEYDEIEDAWRGDDFFETTRELNNEDI